MLKNKIKNKLKKFKKNRIGYHQGYKFKIVSGMKWGDTYIYKLRFICENSHWIEYMEHNKLKKEKVFNTAW